MLTSSLLASEPRIMHGFSSREGGVSVLAHTASMNVAKGHGDPDAVVVKNISLFAGQISGCLRRSLRQPDSFGKNPPCHTG